MKDTLFARLDKFASMLAKQQDRLDKIEHDLAEERLERRWESSTLRLEIRNAARLALQASDFCPLGENPSHGTSTESNVQNGLVRGGKTPWWGKSVPVLVCMAGEEGVEVV